MIRLAIRRPIAVSMLYFAVALLGVAAWRNVPLELLPDTELPKLSVHATWPGASPETTEALLTSPLEEAVEQVRGVAKVTSMSQETNGSGDATITIEFAPGTDMEFARLELSERLGALESALPDGVAGPFVQPYVPQEFQDQDRPFLSYTVTGPYTLEALRARVEDAIAPELRQIRGVAALRVAGGRARLLEIELDPQRALALGLAPQDVARRLRDMSLVGEAGAVFSGGERRTLSIRDPVRSVAEVRALPILEARGRVVRVRDVARVHDTYEEPTSYYRVDGEPAVSFALVKESGGNAVATADAVKASVASLQAGLPSGVRLILDDDRSATIRKQLADLRTRALASALAVFLVLLLFLRSLRSTAIVFATIGFSILITLNFVYFGGLTLNILTLMGLAMGFGLIVDNAIVVLENVYRRRRGGEAAALAAEEGAREVVLPVLAATLTTVVVLVPFVYLQGELRAYYVPLAIVVGFALLASLLVAFTFIPAVGARILGRLGREARESGLGREALGELESGRGPDAAGARPPLYMRFYRGLLSFTLRHPWVTVGVAVLCLAGSWQLFDHYVTKGVVWGRWWGSDTYISIQISQPRGEELARTDELARHFEDRLREMPEVARFVTRVYPRAAMIKVTFPAAIEQTNVPVAIKEQMEAYSHLFGGAQVRVYGYGPSFYGGGGSPPNYSISILGYNYERVRDIAEDLGRRLQRFSRIRDVDTNSSGYFFDPTPATELVVHLDRARLAAYDLTTRDAIGYIAAALAGRGFPGRTDLDGDEVEYTVKLAGASTLDLHALQELALGRRGGPAVRFADVARVEERPVMSRIQREDQQYRRLVAYEFRGPAKLGDRVRDAVVGATALPPGYSIEKQQAYTWSTAEKQQIYAVLAVAIVLVFMVTAALFESLRQPLCVLLAVPMALVGVFLLFFYTGAAFTREAYVGVIMMGGVVVNNAILLIDHINGLRRRVGLALDAAILRGTLERVRPILMTTATTVFGLLPLVLFSPSADSNIWNALAYALIGGLTSSTLLVLTVTPALYLLFERGWRWKRRASVATRA